MVICFFNTTIAACLLLRDLVIRCGDCTNLGDRTGCNRFEATVGKRLVVVGLSPACTDTKRAVFRAEMSEKHKKIAWQEKRPCG